MSVLSKGRPSLSQVRVGGGTPIAEHSKSSGLFTAMVSSSGELDTDIFGGSEVENTMFLLCFSLVSLYGLKIQAAV